MEVGYSHETYVNCVAALRGLTAPRSRGFGRQGQIATPVLTLAGERNYPCLRELLPTQASDVRVVKVNSSSRGCAAVPRTSGMGRNRPFMSQCGTNGSWFGHGL